MATGRSNCRSPRSHVLISVLCVLNSCRGFKVSIAPQFIKTKKPPRDNKAERIFED